MANKKITKKQIRQVKQTIKAVKKSSPGAIFLAFIIFAVAVGGYFIYNKYFKNPYIAPTGELEFHFLELNYGTSGDCTYIKAGDKDILIDAGSHYNSLTSIKSYLDARMTDNKIEYLIVTHADLDHIACLGDADDGETLFDLYEIEVIIDFPKTNLDTATYKDYKKNRDAEVQEGAQHFTALECYNESKTGAQRVYNLSEDGNIKLEILYNWYYDHKASKENDNSVCVQFHHGSRKFLFTGDLMENGEKKLAEKYDFSQVELFKAGHHGSATSSTDILLQEIQPKVCVACCCAGSVEYTDYLPKTFPSEEFYNRISVYTDKIYATSTINRVVNQAKPTVEYTLNGVKINITNFDNGSDLKALHGNVTVVSSSDKDVYVSCTGEQAVLKDTAWFREISSLWASSPK